MNLRPLRARASPFVSTSSAKATWARGDVQFIGRGVPHEAKNTGGNTFLRA